MLSIEIDDSQPQGGLPGFTVARLTGELGTTDVARFIDTLYEYAAGDGAMLAVDLSGLDAIDSRGLSALIQLVTRSRMSQARVILVGPNPMVGGVLNVTRLDTWFEVCATLDEAATRFVEA